MKKFIAVCFLIIALVISISHYNNSQRYTQWENDRKVITVTVCDGDTIDGYWAEYAPDWMSRSTYRKLILDLNDTSDYCLMVGDTILLYR